MKKHICLILALAMLLGLSACGGSPVAVPAGSGTAPPQTVSAEPKPVTETVPGYAPEETALPDWLEGLWPEHSGLSGGWDSDGDTMWFLPDTDDSAETLCAAGYDTVTGTWQRCGISTGEARYPRVKAISTAGGAVWAMIKEYAAGGGRIPDDAGYYLFYKNLNDGTELLSRIPLAGDAGTESSTAELHTILALDGSHVLLTSPSSTYVLDPAANVLGSPALGLNGWPNYMRVNGQLYIYRWDAEDEGFWLLDTDSMSYSRHIPVDGCGCFSSSAGNFNCTVDGALRRFDIQSGANEPVFSWMDVALSADDLGGFSCFENSKGEFFYMGKSGLIRVYETMIPAKRALTLACFGDTNDMPAGYTSRGAMSYSMSDELEDAVIRFNNTDPEYRIVLKPVSYSSSDERDRLLIELATGSDVDVIDTSILPENALKGGLLTDMLPYLDADGAVSRDDFIAPLFNAMLKNGGLYEYTDKFTLMTLISDAGLYPDRQDWTADYIAQQRAERPDMRVPFREDMLEAMIWASTAEFIDWEHMTCSFDSLAFTGWLKLLESLPAEQGYGGAQGVLFSLECDIAGSVYFSLRMSYPNGYVFAGFPEASGSGSYFVRLRSSSEIAGGFFSTPGDTYGHNTRIGIMASSANKDGAWRFVRTLMLGGDDVSLANGIPVSKAGFEAGLDYAASRVQEGYEQFAFTQADADAMRELVYGTTRLVHTDDALLTLIRSEVNAYLGGGKSAEDAAKQLQSRVSVYLAEQS